MFRTSLHPYAALAALLVCGGARAGASSAVVSSEFVNPHPPTAQCHASTLVETRHGLLAAWFGGSHEGAADVAIWVARKRDGHWSRAVKVADGAQADGRRYPTWNPVLFQPRHGPLMLFYKVGPDPRHWWGMRITSTDDGAHWSRPQRLPDGILGPIKDKPVQLADGTIVSPSSTEDHGWRVHFEWSDDGGAHWHRTGAVNDPHTIGAIQPSLLLHRGGTLQAVGRTRQNRVFSVWSHDAGRHWGPMSLLDVDNPNSGLDAVTLADGRMLMVYNPTLGGAHWWNGRGTLAVALSDDGVHWHQVLQLEHQPGQEFSYPAVIQTRDGRIHISYTWKRIRIKHVVLDPRKLQSGPPEAPMPTPRRRHGRGG